ncbi:MAG: ABC transporter substrate-binding protein [Firmicutes bacterium]|nr:ABC transporter substrate-binding protein [Bacillota bacterium]
MKRAGTIAGVLILLLGALLLSPAALAQQEIRIGAIYPRSGSLALLGEESWRGAEIARQERNEAGGILGRQIVFVNADAPNVNAARSEAERLISQQGVQLLIGTYSSALSMAASEAAARRGVTFFELGAISDGITQRGYKTVFRTNPTASMFVAAQMAFLRDWMAPQMGKEPEQLRVAIAHEDSDYGTSVAENMRREAERLGLNLVSVQPYSSTSTDLSSVILRLRAASPDVIVAVSYAQDAILLQRQAHELGLRSKVVGTGGGHSLSSFYEALGDLAEGVFNVDFTQYEVNTAFTPGLEEFRERYRATFGEEPRSGHSLANYMGAHVLFDIIERSGGSLDPERIRASTLSYVVRPGQLATGWGVRFDETGQNVGATPLVTQWRGGKLVTVWPEQAAVMAPVLIE